MIAASFEPLIASPLAAHPPCKVYAILYRLYQDPALYEAAHIIGCGGIEPLAFWDAPRLPRYGCSIKNQDNSSANIWALG